MSEIFLGIGGVRLKIQRYILHVGKSTFSLTNFF